MRQLQTLSRTKHEHSVFAGVLRWRAIRSSSRKALSEASFAEIYGIEEQCHAALVKWRWPNGFECPGCNGADHCVVTRGARRLFQCNACRRQTSVTAGTIFASSKLPLRIWFGPSK